VSESDFNFSLPEDDDEGESAATVTSGSRSARSSRKFPIRLILIAAVILALLCGGAILLLRGPLGGLLGRGAVAEATPIPTPAPEAEATALPTEEPVGPTLRPSPTSLVEATALGGEEEEEPAETPSATSEEPIEEEEEPGEEPTEEPGVEETPTPEAECPVTHVVERGETLSVIAREYGVTWQQIAAASDIADPDRIKPGQELTIPCAEEGEGEGGEEEQVHVVQRGETLYRIAQQYDVDWQELAEYNDLDDPTRIFPGDVIRIPPSE
jgi:LysM repeat protein